jgi:type IV pilus assembly protein PilW
VSAFQSTQKHQARGMTLVELMVAMVIGLGLTLAVTSMLITSENHKRVTTSTNDAEQAGAYAFYAMDRVIRSAGSAIADSAYPVDRGVLGCKVNAAYGGAAILPRAAAFPAPFAGFLSGAPANLRLAPLIIGRNQGQLANSDVIMVMAGSGAAGGVPRQITSSGTSTTAPLDNSVGFQINDLVVVSQSGIPDCLLEQVSANPGTSSTLALAAGTPFYYAGGATTLASLTASTASYLTPVGNYAANNVQFLLYGLSADRTLYSYDILRSAGGDTTQSIADNVYQMRAVYGIDTGTTGTVGNWVDPIAPNWDPATVMASTTKMRQILAVHIALIVRGAYSEKPDLTCPATAQIPSPPSITVNSNLRDATNTVVAGLSYTYNLTCAERWYRYRVFEFTVPLRNMLLLAGAAAP